MRHREKLRQDIRKKERERERKLKKYEKEDKEEKKGKEKDTVEVNENLFLGEFRSMFSVLRDFVCFLNKKTPAIDLVIMFVLFAGLQCYPAKKPYSRVSLSSAKNAMFKLGEHLCMAVGDKEGWLKFVSCLFFCSVNCTQDELFLACAF